MALSADWAKSIVKRPARRSRLNCWRKSISTSDSSSTTRIRRLTCLVLLCGGQLDISLIASAALRHTALSSIRGSKRILFYTQTVMKKCETLHIARVINCGRLLEWEAASSCYCTETGEQR